MHLFRHLLPDASDLSPEIVARWPAHDGGECPRCGAFRTGRTAENDAPCPACAKSPPPYDAARSLFPYTGDVRSAIVAAKYAGRPFPADAVAARLADALSGRWRDLIPADAAPVVVPVPVHPWKYFRRGFHLPARIGARLAYRAGLPFFPIALVRHRERPAQAGLPGIRRRGNVEGAFRTGKPPMRAAAVLLVDDVFTTGATVEACSRVLKCAGAASIVVLTVARAVH